MYIDGKSTAVASNMNDGEGRRIFVLSSDPSVLEKRTFPLLDSCHVSLFCDISDFKRNLEAGEAPDLLVMDWDTPSGGDAESATDLIARVHASYNSIPIMMLPSNANSNREGCLRSASMDDRVLDPRQCKSLDGSMGPNRDGVVSRTHSEVLEIPIDQNTWFVRASKPMHDVDSQCRLVARTNIPVLVLGESGTGKEVAAKLIHKLSPRNQRPFLKVNCAAMPADLLESELFGYEQGAFTGALRAKPGKFEICDHGTIFLDEIGEMPCPLQAKMLQVLQDGSFSRLGGRSSVKVDVRVIAATNINMHTAIAAKTFREDLYYRLNGFTLKMPPLRERKEEIAVLAHHFARKAAEMFDCPLLSFSPSLMQALINHSWPGNLRELENVVKRYLILADEQAIVRDLQPVRANETLPSNGKDGFGTANLKHLARSAKGDAESAAIAQSLEVTGWNRKAAALELKISYKALLYKIKQYNLEPPRRRLTRSVADV
jgi:DNA-binding NtrC family response regulator